jgi:hypothetical protein
MKNDRVLMVVDIQEEFQKCISNEYLKDVRKYVRTGKWDKIIIVVDINNDKAYIPRWLDRCADNLITKRFGGDLGYLKELILEEEMIVEKEDISWRSTYNHHLTIAINNGHETFEVPKELENISNQLKNKKVTLIGGCEGECLQDIYETLLYFEVKPKINEKYTYSGHDFNKGNIFFEEEYDLVEINE